ncbi:MAG: PIN domain-containing protein [Candidatus Cloacimonetes bacterium]|nr:PIN domain-containing protein [Candidatus Cloacimonadota bacterium]
MVFFDTNVLIDLHRKRPLSLAKFKIIMNKTDFCIVNQTFEEYKTQVAIIVKGYKKHLNDLSIRTDNAINCLINTVFYDGTKIFDDDGLRKLEELKDYVKTVIKNEKGKIYDSDNEKTFEELKEFISDKLLPNPFSVKEIIQIFKEGEIRYSNKIPPGYMDQDKENNKYGDLIIWKELIYWAKKNSEDVLFVTNDNKPDWKSDFSQQKLKQEFFEETGQKIHILNSPDFFTLKTEEISNSKSFEKVLSKLKDQSELFEAQTKEMELSAMYSNMLNDAAISPELSGLLGNQAFQKEVAMLSKLYDQPVYQAMAKEAAMLSTLYNQPVYQAMAKQSAMLSEFVRKQELSTIIKQEEDKTKETRFKSLEDKEKDETE